MTEDEVGEDLPRFGAWRPTQFDQPGLGSDGQEDWRVLPVSRNRDSGPLAESNFAVAQRILDDAGAEYECHRFGHWGPGWFEILVIKPDTVGLTAAGSIVAALDCYPVLDDDDHSEREMSAVQANWEGWQESDFMRHIEAQVSERAYEIIDEYAPLGDLQMLVADKSTGYAYNGDDPSYDTPLDAIGRDEIATLLLAAIANRNAARGAK